jgi:GTP-binding protein HflX
MITVLNKVDRCENRAMILRMKFKYPNTVEISALHQTGFDALLDAMIREISLLRKIVKLRVPQSHYALVTDVMREGKILSLDYEENDILLEVEIPQHLEHKIAHFIVV